MTATPPRADLRTLATLAAHDVDCPEGPNCGDELTTDGRYGRYADAVLAAVLPEHRRTVLGEIADDLHRVATHLRAANSDSSVAKGVRYAEARIRAQLAAAPPAGLSATVPAGNAPAVPEEADGRRRTGCARCDTDEMTWVCHCRRECSSGICSAMDQTPAPAPVRQARGDALTYAEMESERDRLAGEVAGNRRVVEAAKAWRAADSLRLAAQRAIDIRAAVDALPDAGTDQTEDDRGHH